MNFIYKNIPNYFSFLRVLLVIPFWITLNQGQNYTALLIGLIAGFSDFLDGFFARKLNLISEFGKIIDPLADKIFVSAVMISLFLQHKVAFWIIAVVILRDILILIGASYISRKIHFVPPSNIIGKITVNIYSMVFIAILVDFKPIIEYQNLILLISATVSLIVYIISSIRLIKKNDYNHNEQPS